MTHMSVEDLKARLDAGEQVNLLDVREVYERQEFNIGGVHHRLGQIQVMDFDDIEDWKDKEVVIYCRSGNRSQIAGLIMETAGFKHVINLTGGMLSWQDKFGR